MPVLRVLVAGLLMLGGILGQEEGEAPKALRRPNPARDAALMELIPLTSGVREDDHPAAAATRDGHIWVVWVSYSAVEGRSRIFARSLEGGTWSNPIEVSDRPGDYHKPAITIDASSRVWVAWPAQVGSNWDIYCRVYEPSKKKWSGIERVTTDAGPDFGPQLAASGSRVMLVWQAMRRDNFDILYRIYNGRWNPEGFVTEEPVNAWEPSVAATTDGAFHVAWDSYRGDYDVLMRSWKDAGWGETRVVASTARSETRTRLCPDRAGRLWIAWETGPERWAHDSSDGGLRSQVQIGLACLENGGLKRAPEAERALAGLLADRQLVSKSGSGEVGQKGAVVGQVMQSPAIWIGPNGGLRVFYRTPINKNLLVVESAVWNGLGWSTPERLRNSEGRVDQAIAMADLKDRVFVCYPAGTAHNYIYGRFFRDGGSLPKLEPAPAALAAKTANRARGRHMLNNYQLIWGDLHRHTDISEDGGIGDGSLLDTMRYALDAAGLDFIGTTDHTRYLTRRYNLWRTQQTADLFYKAGSFSAMHSYERSQNSPWGHRNVILLDRNYEPVPASYDEGDLGVSPLGLFAALRGKSALSIPHTTAWAAKQVSWDYADPDVERLVEMYQGRRSTYEYNGAPDPADRAVYEKDSKSFVWDALARKIQLGFIASSDHRSTHMSYAAVYSKGIDRQSIFDALRARRTYAATDKILLDFTIAGHLMGEVISLRGQPELQISVIGTAKIAQVDVIRSGKFIYRLTPNETTSKFQFRDEGYRGEESYYYVRVIQTDKNMAWASPIWVKGEK
jgi:hypothetical protein